jgi:hypothetical protein
MADHNVARFSQGFFLVPLLSGMWNFQVYGFAFSASGMRHGGGEVGEFTTPTSRAYTHLRLGPRLTESRGFAAARCATE